MSEHSKRFAQMHPDEDFEMDGNDWINDFEVLSVENGATYGICYPESRICRTYLAKHESEKDIINTSGRHEPIHACLTDFVFYGDPDEALDMMDMEQEHKLIQRMSWVEDDGILDQYTSLYNGEHIKPKISEKDYERLMNKVNKMSDEIDQCIPYTDKELKALEKDWNMDVEYYLSI